MDCGHEILGSESGDAQYFDFLAYLSVNSSSRTHGPGMQSGRVESADRRVRREYLARCTEKNDCGEIVKVDEIRNCA